MIDTYNKENMKTTTLTERPVEFQSGHHVDGEVNRAQYIGTVVEITKKFTFEAGHFVPNHGGRCKFIHGHSYKLYVTVVGPIREDGMVMDFKDLNTIVDTIIDPYDHGFLNDYYELPTAEVMAVDIMNRVETELNTHFEDVHCQEIVLYETEKCSAKVRRKCDCNEC